MKRRLMLSYVLLWLVFTMAVAAPLTASAWLTTEVWVARYNNSLENGPDFANAIAVDASGNVYVTGRSERSGTDYDYLTIKYDTDGNELWTVPYNGPGNGRDFASAIAIDSLGNVYVTGRSEGVGTDYDYATVKYSQPTPDTVEEEWAKRYDGPASGLDSASAIAIDSLGNVYVTGRSENIGTGYDYATIKYDANGNQLWEGRYNGPGDAFDQANAIAVDASGNVYVTGESEGSGIGIGDDYATVKYSQPTPDTVEEEWVARYDGPTHGHDAANAIAVDASGNVYVTGESYGVGTDYDYATVKYDTTNGNQLWVKRYDGPAHGYDVANAIGIDASGVYVTGESYGGIGTGYDYATVKYDTDGKELWVARYDGPAHGYDVANAIAIDASGNIYVTGRSYGIGTGDDYATVKYDTDGKELWVARYNSPGSDSDIANAIGIDASGNVYVTGRSDEGSGADYDYATVKYGVTEVTMVLPEGWSMISLPVWPEIATVTTLFPDAVVAYRYQKGMGYVRVRAGEDLEVGMGYWIKLNSSASYVMRGAKIMEYTIPVEDSWYMIGGNTDPAQKKVVTQGTIDVIYGYTQGIGYTRLRGSEPLEPGMGYWIKLSDTSGGSAFTASTSVSK